MFRTEVVKSKNIRKSILYKVFNGISILLLVFIIVLVSNVIPDDSALGKIITVNYDSIIQPVVMGIAFLLIIISIYTRNASKNPKRIGSLELTSDEVRFLINDELQETLKIDEVSSIDFEYYSFRMRGNPMGCMNYLTFNTDNESKKFEIVIANTMVKAELGEVFNTISEKVPVNVKYAYFMKKIFKDSDFNFDTKH
ncbi:MAG: hypothetical protein JXR50_04685 [Prolixibacteraceae bacterium]|nr:hypothetical protein [Prolixibacteraceae bacterium]MBN2649020.1 hypothetical protein [Prolixibacteraceae bacterium]